MSKEDLLEQFDKINDRIHGCQEPSETFYHIKELILIMRKALEEIIKDEKKDK